MQFCAESGLGGGLPGTGSARRYRKNRMARVTPPLSLIRPLTAGDYAELELLRGLAHTLPESFELFHSVDWTQANVQGDRHGELDIVVVNSAGDVAILEVKAGQLNIGTDAVSKQYHGEEKDVIRQAQWQFSGIQHRLRSEGLNGRLMHFLVLPDQRVGDQSTVAYPRERIADAEDCQDLPGFVERKLGSGRPDELKDRVCAFLQDRLLLKTDVAALSARLQGLVAKISGGLADWVPRIHAPQGVIRVLGTAGSGKTQLALALLRQARVKGQAVAYVCFNRPLADHMRDIAPKGVQVASFHQLCWEAAGRPQGEPDFAALTTQYIARREAAEPDLDMLLVDELQDMRADWVQALLARVRDTGRIYLLDDPSQCLYEDRDEIEIPDAVLVRSGENYRSPRRIVETINLLRLTGDPVVACCPFVGDMPGFQAYCPDGNGLLRETVRAVQRCLDKGFALEDIVVLCWRGRESSRLMSEGKLGAWGLMRFTGGYDDRGQPLWTEGELRIETLRRFKGQAAKAVVLTEVHFDELSPTQRNLLFVGMTRACMHLELVLTEAAEAAIASFSELGGPSGGPPQR